MQFKRDKLFLQEIKEFSLEIGVFRLETLRFLENYLRFLRRITKVAASQTQSRQIWKERFPKTGVRIRVRISGEKEEE